MPDRPPVLMLLPLFLLLISVSAQYDFGLMLDAGSSGTRLSIFKWPSRATPSVPLVAAVRDQITNAVLSLKKNPGLSSFNTNLTAIADYLAPFIQYAKDNLPVDKWNETEIFLRATAGMRLLSATDQDNILSQVRAVFGAGPFRFSDPSWARVITGQEEGVFAWIATNYLTNILGTNSPTVGALDLGGASTQIAFVSQLPPVTSNMTISMPPVIYSLYAYSYLRYGVDQARLWVLENLVTGIADGEVVAFPCSPAGYSETFVSSLSSNVYNVTGSGNLSACKELTDALMFANTPCDSTCAINGTYQPLLTGSFYATSAYYYLTSFLFGNNITTLRLNEIIPKADTYCSLPWDNVTAQYPGNTFLKVYCFYAAHVQSLLTSFGFSLDTPVYYALSLNGTEIGWALGAMIYEANLLPLDAVPITTPPAATTPSPSSSNSASTTPPVGTVSVQPITSNSQPSPTATSTSTTSAPTSAPGGSNGLANGLLAIIIIVGILVVVAIVILVVGIVYWLCCKAGRGEDTYKEMN